MTETRKLEILKTINRSIDSRKAGKGLLPNVRLSNDEVDEFLATYEQPNRSLMKVALLDAGMADSMHLFWKHS